MKCSCGLELQPKTEACPQCGRSMRDLLEERDNAAVTAADWVQQAKDWYSQGGSREDVRECFEVAARKMEVDEAVRFAEQLLKDPDGKMLADILFDEVRRYWAAEGPYENQELRGDYLVELARNWNELLHDKQGAYLALGSAESCPYNDSIDDTFQAYRKWFGDDRAALSALETMEDVVFHDPLYLYQQVLFVQLALELPRDLAGRDNFIKDRLEAIAGGRMVVGDEDVNNVIEFAVMAKRDFGDVVLAGKLLKVAEDIDRRHHWLEEIAKARVSCGLKRSRGELLALLALAPTKEMLSGRIIDADEDLAGHIAGFLFGSMDDLSMDIFNEKTTAIIRMEFQADGVRLSVPQLADRDYHPGVLLYADLSDAELTALHALTLAQ